MLHAASAGPGHAITGVELAGLVTDEGFGLMTAIKLPGGGELGLYEPRHPSPIAGVGTGG